MNARPPASPVVELATVCTVARRARAAAASVALLSATASPQLWAGATVRSDRDGWIAGWDDPRSRLPVTVRVVAPRRRGGGVVETAAAWTLGEDGRGGALLHVAPRGHRYADLGLTVFGDPGVTAHALRPACEAFLRRLAAAAEHRSFAP